MTIIFALLLYYIAIRFFAKDSKKSTYFLLGIIVTVLLVLSELDIIISDGVGEYFKSSGWQVIVALFIFCIYLLVDRNSYRNLRFKMKMKKGKNQKIVTVKTKKMYVFFLAVLSVVIGGVLLMGKLLDYFDFGLIPIIGSFVAFVAFVATIVILSRVTVEKLVLIIDTENALDIYSKVIETKKSFNHLDYIGEINRYYIIERLGNVSFNGEIREIDYVWHLKTQKLSNYDISKLPMDRETKSYYGELIEPLTLKKGLDLIITIENGKIVKANKR